MCVLVCVRAWIYRLLVHAKLQNFWLNEKEIEKENFKHSVNNMKTMALCCAHTHILTLLVLTPCRHEHTSNLFVHNPLFDTSLYIPSVSLSLAFHFHIKIQFSKLVKIESIRIPITRSNRPKANNEEKKYLSKYRAPSPFGFNICAQYSVLADVGCWSFFQWNHFPFDEFTYISMTLVATSKYFFALLENSIVKAYLICSMQLKVKCFDTVWVCESEVSKDTENTAQCTTGNYTVFVEWHNKCMCGIIECSVEIELMQWMHRPKRISPT